MMTWIINSRLLALTLLAAAGLGLPACSFMDVRSPSQTFVLAPGAPPRAAKPVQASVSVDFVGVSSPYSTGNFQYRLTDSDWETDPYNRFLSSPQEMMTGVIRSWLEKSKAFSTVRLPAAGGTADFQIQCDVTALFIDFRDAANPSAVVAMEFRVTRATTDGAPDVVLRKSFESRSSVAARTPEAFVDAWNRALRDNLLSFSSALNKR